jgi:hypothetical protein
MNATTKHNALVTFLSTLCKAAGLPHELEPRGFQSYTCPKCSKSDLGATGARAHRAQCHVDLIRSGPDLRITWTQDPSSDSDTYYDVTYIHETAPCYINHSTKDVILQKTLDKNKKYVASGMILPQDFVVLPILSLGSIHDNVRRLMERLAPLVDREPADLYAELSVRSQEYQGAMMAAVLDLPRPGR